MKIENSKKYILLILKFLVFYFEENFILIK